VFGDTPNPEDSERFRRLEAEAEVDRELKDGAPASKSLLDRWHAWRQGRRTPPTQDREGPRDSA
jgi:hypothetical protein